MLENLGLPELIAQTPEQFVSIAVELANDLPRLKDLRATLRDRLERSPLMDAPRFARSVEAAYRNMWQRWCAKQLPAATPASEGRTDSLMSNIQITYGNDTFNYRVALMKLHVPGIKTLVAFRPDTSDVPTFIQIFIAKSYALLTQIPVRLIVDGGANVGYASLFFANQFPQAQIVAIEPDGDNFTVLRENTWYYPNIRLIQAGIWNKPGELNLVTHDDSKKWLGHWGVRVEESAESGKSGVKAITIDEILQSTGRKYIDILKLDIEGAEKEVFSDNYASWLSRTNILVIELHDRFKAGCTEVVSAAIRQFDFTEYQKGENTFFFRKAPLVE